MSWRWSQTSWWAGDGVREPWWPHRSGFWDPQNKPEQLPNLAGRMILSTTNKVVDSINEKVMSMLPTAETIYHSVDSVPHNDDAYHWPIEFLNGLSISGLSPHKLHLKLGIPFMLMRNMDRCCSPTSSWLNCPLSHLLSLPSFVLERASSLSFAYTHGQWHILWKHRWRSIALVIWDHHQLITVVQEKRTHEWNFAHNSRPQAWCHHCAHSKWSQCWRDDLHSPHEVADVSAREQKWNPIAKSTISIETCFCNDCQ